MRYYAENTTSLSSERLQYLVQIYLETHPSEVTDAFFKNLRPSSSLIREFPKRHGLEGNSIRVIDSVRADTFTEEHCAEHLDRVSAIMCGHRIQDSFFILTKPVHYFRKWSAEVCGKL